MSIDNGSTDCDTLSEVPPEPYDIGLRAVALTAENAKGAVTSCTAEVTATDVSPPQITCPPDPNPVERQGSGRASIDPGDATAHDFSDVTLTDTRASSYPLGETKVFYQGKDAAGNVAGRSTTVAVLDNTAPAITCPERITGRCAVERSFTVTASDARDPSPSVSCTDADGNPVDPAGHAFSVDDTTVRCTATDGSGNARQCTFVALISDSLICAINRLIETVRAEPDLDPFEDRMLKHLEAAAALADRVDELIAHGRTHRAARLLRAINGHSREFGRILRSQRGRRSIPGELRRRLITEQVSIRDEVRAFRKKLLSSA